MNKQKDSKHISLWIPNSLYNGAIEYPFIKDDKNDDDEWFFE